MIRINKYIVFSASQFYCIIYYCKYGLVEEWQSMMYHLCKYGLQKSGKGYSMMYELSILVDIIDLTGVIILVRIG